jgi:hypothetical protein
LKKELRAAHLIMDSILLFKDQLQEHLDTLKFSWENEFNEIIEYLEEKVEKWLMLKTHCTSSFFILEILRNNYSMQGLNMR